MRTLLPLITAAAIALGPAARSLSAQVGPGESRHRTATVLGANALFAGLAAGISAGLDRRPFWPAFAKGATGGVIMYAGKRISASETDAMGLVGRQVSAVGASVARNAMLGSPVLDTLILPLGPTRLAWSTEGRNISGVHVDTEAVAWAMYGLTSDRYSLDAERSLAAGTLVFTTDEIIGHHPGEGYVTGLTGGGAVFLSEPDLTFNPGSREHELVHVGQTDYLKMAFGVPLERWVLRKIGLEDAAFFQHVDLGVGHYPLQGVLRPYLETEADWFEHIPR